MSKRRKSGEIIARKPGSGFTGSAEPRLLRIEDKESGFHCCLDCGDPHCREWDNLLIIEGPHKGNYIYHISECEMEDP